MRPPPEDLRRRPDLGAPRPAPAPTAARLARTGSAVGAAFVALLGCGPSPGASRPVTPPAVAAGLAPEPAAPRRRACRGIVDSDGRCQRTPLEAPPISDLALVAGRWNGHDHESWIYELEIQIGGTFSQTVQQSGGSLCTQEGTVELYESQMVRTFSSNECNAAFEGEIVYDDVLSIDRDSMRVRTDSGYQIDYERVR